MAQGCALPERKNCQLWFLGEAAHPLGTTVLFTAGAGRQQCSCTESADVVTFLCFLPHCHGPQEWPDNRQYTVLSLKNI